MKNTYYVTKLAGRDVAGQRSPGEGKTIKLTESQAAQPLRQGYISVANPKAARKEVAPKMTLGKTKKQ